jgi:hypothetical protein
LEGRLDGAKFLNARSKASSSRSAPLRLVGWRIGYLIDLAWPIMPEYAAIQEIANVDVLEGHMVPRELTPQMALERINAFVSQLCIGK